MTTNFPMPPSPAASTLGSQTGTPVRAPQVPKKPKFGGIREIAVDTWAAWTGGKPKSDWSELEDPDPKQIVATQYRPTSISSQLKSRPYRIAGLANKFSRGSNLQTFEKKIMKHLEAFGMDTNTYLQSPTNKAEVVSVIESHSLFTLKEGTKLGNSIKEKYFDEHSLENDHDAKEFLYASVDEKLEKQLYENCDKDISFVGLWLNLIYLVRSVSIDRFDRVKKQLKGRKISSYEGEDVEELASDYLSDYNDLHGAKMYDHNLTLHMLNEIMSAGESGYNEDFRHALRGLKKDLNEKLLDVRHVNYDSSQIHGAG